MPMPTESLTRQSTDDEIRQAVSDTIAQLVNEGRDQDQAEAIALDSARRHAGRVPGEAAAKGKLKMSARQGAIGGTT
jgi:hypothetical protein